MDFRTHPIAVTWLRTNTVVCRLLMCEFIIVSKRSYRKVMFSRVCVILFIVECIQIRPRSISDLPPPSKQTVNGRACNRHNTGMDNCFKDNYRFHTVSVMCTEWTLPLYNSVMVKEREICGLHIDPSDKTAYSIMNIK